MQLPCIFAHFHILLHTYACHAANKFVWASIDVTYTGDSTVHVHVCKHTKLENGALCNGQELGSTVNSFINLDEFETIKTLSGRRVLCCDEHQFRAKMTVSTQTVFEIPSLKTVLYRTVLRL